MPMKLLELLGFSFKLNPPFDGEVFDIDPYFLLLITKTIACEEGGHSIPPPQYRMKGMNMLIPLLMLSLR